jgi:uncharacterized surface anchored protein
MNRMPMGIVALLAVVLVASPLFAADTTIRGKVKSTNADKNEFVLDDANGKSNTIALDKDAMINRNGKDAKIAELKAGDDVSVCFAQGIFKGTAHYVLVHDDSNKTCDLGVGKVKAYDATKGELVLTDAANRDVTYQVPATSKVQVNTQPGKIADVKVGEMVTIIADMKDGKSVMRELIVQRK